MLAIHPALPGIAIIDEEAIDTTLPVKIPRTIHTLIIRMPETPPDFFAIPSFANWYQARLQALEAYAVMQNACAYEMAQPLRLLVRTGTQARLLRELLAAQRRVG